VENSTIFEQGAGLLNIKKLLSIDDDLVPTVTIFPHEIDITNNNIYFYPFSN
jgi:hypothetical protein